MHRKEIAEPVGLGCVPEGVACGPMARTGLKLNKTIMLTVR